MCGISGFYNYQRPEAGDILGRMNTSLSHRGPDGEGIFLEDGIGLAHRRLAIIDIATGYQPMTSSDGRYVTVFNGEIYNYIELKEELSAQGSVFKTSSDTEVIAEALKVWGIEKALVKFRGMFAFAVLDRKDRTLYLARDRTGIKPLYWAEKNKSVFFASEIKALLNVPEISRKADVSSMNDFLTLGFTIPPKSIWKDMKCFPPAHYAVIKANGETCLRRYWELNLSEKETSLDQAVEDVEEKLADALKYHVRSDVPLGAFLSGGIDSSLLVYLLKKKGIVDKISTFNVKFSDNAFDESPYAEEVSKIIGTDHHVLEISEGTPEILEKILLQYDEPFGDSSCIPTYLISQRMREHVKTVISGDGGDELFGGYDRIRNSRILYGLKNLPFKSLASGMLLAISPMIGKDRYRKYSKVISFSKAELPELFCLLHTYFSEKDKESMLTSSFLEAVRKESPSWKSMSEYIPENRGARVENLMLGMEFNLNLHADYLRKVDIASSAHGIEVRVPFLDNEVIDFSAQLPLKLKISSGEDKHLLREAFRRHISPGLGSRKKQGFGIPFDSWCNGRMRGHIKDLLFSDPAGEGLWRVVDRKEVLALHEAFSSPSTRDYGLLSRHQIYQRIFMLCGLQTWIRKFNPEF
ncbi:MAG TPA: asparagine synthase (glutamine-hydrolyzing) [Lentisphaeria bacterium]|nr:MAG: asparagine synthase (glutamine-hydrolyzing) [Lentisphaerae bacterium GWF2_50_93]HCE45608.1 asparagine synthase (glutamine-hydrolyzing) [Lentisphaeria bacterium]